MSNSVELHGKHSNEAAEKRGMWLRWHDGSEVGVPPGFYLGGKSASALARPCG